MLVSQVRIDAGNAVVDAEYSVPPGATGCVVFVHGTGSSRFSRRNRYVARVLNDAALATLLADLLTPGEAALDERTRALRFDVSLLADRTANLTGWVTNNELGSFANVGLFGASTGAAAAIIAAVRRPDDVRAVVSRGGRVDLATEALSQLRAPLLTIIGEDDAPLIPLHQAALQRVNVEHRHVIVPNAGHLFEETGALDAVAREAAEWFDAFLR